MHSYFFRVIEQEDGTWVCRRGREELGWREELEAAVEHTTRIANDNLPSQVFVHHLDGRVRLVATLD